MSLFALRTGQRLVQEDPDVVQVLLVGLHDGVGDLRVDPVKVAARAARGPNQTQAQQKPAAANGWMG